VARAVNLHLLKAEDFVLAFYDMIIVHKYGSYETCSSLHLSYPCACSAGFRRPSTALSGETNAARPRPSDHYREQLTLNTTEERAEITGIACGARSEVTQNLRAGLKHVTGVREALRVIVEDGYVSFVV
jgi:hypothetical protein